MVCLSPDICRQLNSTKGTVTNTMGQINLVVYHRSAHYSSKEDFEEALQSELPAGIWNLMEERLREGQQQTEWVRAVVEQRVRDDQTLQGLVVVPP